MVNALVTGATGYVGSRLVCALHRAGHRVVATGRDPGKFAAFDWPDDVVHVRLDVADPPSYRAELVSLHDDLGIDAAFYLVHEIGSADYAETDVRQARGFAEACRDTGVGRVVYLGGIVPHEHLSEHLRSRAAVGEALRRSGLALVWLRAAMIIGAGSTSFELMRHVVDRLPIVPLPSWTGHDLSPIAVDDVLRYLVAAADRDTVPAGDYDLGNGETMTYRALIERYVHVNGRQRLLVPVPGVPTQLAAPVAAAVTPLPKALAADLIESLQNTMTAHDARIRDLVPDPPAGMTTTDGALERSTVPDVLRGVCATSDPLVLSDTDPKWAR